MAVFLLHGIVDEYVRGASAYRNYVPRDAFEDYLRSRRVPFAAWSADGAAGDVLTVDDATRAGAHACLCARRMGHEVMFLVNPYQIATGQPYSLSVLDAVIDARSVPSVVYRGVAYDLTNVAGVLGFRFAVMRLLTVKPAPDAYAEVMELAPLLGADRVQIGEPHRPISLAELIALRDAGGENRKPRLVARGDQLADGCGIRGARRRRSGVAPTRGVRRRAPVCGSVRRHRRSGSPPRVGPRRILSRQRPFPARPLRRAVLEPQASRL
jgi:hypothetical protein